MYNDRGKLLGVLRHVPYPERAQIEKCLELAFQVIADDIYLSLENTRSLVCDLEAELMKILHGDSYGTTA